MANNNSNICAINCNNNNKLLENARSAIERINLNTSPQQVNMNPLETTGEVEVLKRFTTFKDTCGALQILRFENGWAFHYTSMFALVLG